VAAITCSKCGGPLPAGALDTVVTCPFCGTASRIGATGSVVVVRGGAGVAGALVVFVALGIGGAVLVIGVVLAIFAAGGPQQPTFTPPPSPPAVVAAPVEPPRPVEPPKITAATIATIDHSNWFDVDSTGMPGGFATVDPATVAPWLDGLARAWATDARLQRVDLTGVRADGTLDLRERDDWRADFRYFSPARRESHAKLAEVSETPFYTEIRFWIAEGEVRGILDTVGRFDDEAAKATAIVPSCPLPKVFAAWAADMPKRPFYDTSLRWRESRNAGWRWELDGDGTSKLPGVDGVSCEAIRSKW
jgi:hypothetical protein